MEEHRLSHAWQRLHQIEVNAMLQAKQEKSIPRQVKNKPHSRALLSMQKSIVTSLTKNEQKQRRNDENDD